MYVCMYVWLKRGSCFNTLGLKVDLRDSKWNHTHDQLTKFKSATVSELVRVSNIRNPSAKFGLTIGPVSVHADIGNLRSQNDGGCCTGFWVFAHVLPLSVWCPLVLWSYDFCRRTYPFGCQTPVRCRQTHQIAHAAAIVVLHQVVWSGRRARMSHSRQEQEC